MKTEFLSVRSHHIALKHRSISAEKLNTLSAYLPVSEDSVALLGGSLEHGTAGRKCSLLQSLLSTNGVNKLCSWDSPDYLSLQASVKALWKHWNNPLRLIYPKVVHLNLHLCLWNPYPRLALKSLYVSFDRIWIFKQLGLLTSLLCSYFETLKLNKIYWFFVVCWHSSFGLSCVISFYIYLICLGGWGAGKGNWNNLGKTFFLMQVS